MKNIRYIVYALFILFQSGIIACHQTSRPTASYPFMEYGMAELSGKLSGNIPNDLKTASFELYVSNPIASERKEYAIPVREDGSFSISIPLVYFSSGLVKSPFYNGVLFLAPNEETILNINFDQNGNTQIDMHSTSGLTIEDSNNMEQDITDLVMNTLSGGNEYDMQPEAFADISMTQLKGNLNSYNSNSPLPQKAKEIVMNEIKLFYLENALFDYIGTMKRRYKQQKGDTAYEPKVPNKSYYSFLKEFDLGNQDYLSCTFYPIIIQSILKNKVFEIPPIEETKIDDWINNVKKNMKDIIGSDRGLIYDMLASTSYAVQLNDMQPLSETQKKNIESYFTNEAFTKTLLNENTKVLEIIDKNRAAKRFTINETPKVDKSQLMDVIVSKYKGKVIFVDFWATWCGPCLKAMKEAESVKKEFKNEDVVFVYITNISSVRKTWELKVPEIGGEHYYLKQEEWDYIFDSFNFSGIPAYLIYDTKGELRRKNTSFMGTKNMHAWIKELISK